MIKLKQKIQSMAVASVAAVAMASCSGVDNSRFVILHTNDMHSQIDPSADGTGGMLRQKVVVDSVKSCVGNVCVVDAGDMVQGTLYYHMYKGKVEFKMINNAEKAQNVNCALKVVPTNSGYFEVENIDENKTCECDNVARW